MSEMYLMGDEDGGVSVYCTDCWDGGRPLAYYVRYDGDPYANDSKVTAVTTVDELAAFAQGHVRHGAHEDTHV